MMMMMIVFLNCLIFMFVKDNSFCWRQSCCDKLKHNLNINVNKNINQFICDVSGKDKVKDLHPNQLVDLHH